MTNVNSHVAREVSMIRARKYFETANVLGRNVLPRGSPRLECRCGMAAPKTSIVIHRGQQPPHGKRRRIDDGNNSDSRRPGRPPAGDAVVGKFLLGQITLGTREDR